MKSSLEDIDRRKYKRFKVPADTFVIVKNPKFRIGQIIDMSESGFAIYCVDCKMPSGNFEVDILLADDDYCVDKVKVNNISDITVEVDSSIKSNNMKRYGLAFVDLTKTQKTRLACFIPKHGNGFLQDRRCVTDRRDV